MKNNFEPAVRAYRFAPGSPLTLGKHMVKKIIVILFLFSSTTLGSHENEREMNQIRAGLKTSFSTNRNDTINNLIQKIQTGTPSEKDAALYVVEDELIEELIPYVIAAVTDMTPAPRYDDTGWEYIGRHAGHVVAKFINKLDPTWIQNNGYVGTRFRDICNDTDREMLKSLLTQWWLQYQKKESPTSG